MASEFERVKLEIPKHSLLELSKQKMDQEIDRYCPRCSKEENKVLMHTASIQMTENGEKHFIPVALMCHECFDWRFLPVYQKEARYRGGWIRDDPPHILRNTETGEEHIVRQMSKLDFADTMMELGQIKRRLMDIGDMMERADGFAFAGKGGSFSWKKYLKLYFESVWRL